MVTVGPYVHFTGRWRIFGFHDLAFLADDDLSFRNNAPEGLLHVESGCLRFRQIHDHQRIQHEIPVGQYLQPEFLGTHASLDPGISDCLVDSGHFFCSARDDVHQRITALAKSCRYLGRCRVAGTDNDDQAVLPFNSLQDVLGRFRGKKRSYGKNCKACQRHEKKAGFPSD